MKLYIPTCTLNFNNIFSTESISPAQFYRTRGFGNKRYYKVEANNKDNVILLYSKYPQFRVENDDLENGPMVIEIETENAPFLSIQKIDEKDSVQIFSTSSTIYLSPFNTIIYFESYQDLQDILTKSEQSLENKYTKLYSNNFKIRQQKAWSFSGMFSEKDYFNWNDSFVRNADNLEEGNPLMDLFVDRLKGCLVCYLIGANTSVSPEIGRLKQLARKIRNVLSAVVNSPDHKPSESQDSTLLNYIKEFNSIYSKLDDNSKYNSALINNRLVSPSTGLDKDILNKVLEDLDLTDVFLRRLNLRPVYNAYEVYDCLNSSTLSDALQNEIARMNEAIKRLEIVRRQSQQKRRLSDLISYEDKRVVINDPMAGKGMFFPALLESQMKGDFKSFMDENGIDERLAVAFVGGAKLKTFFKENWEGSQYQIYVNGLLGNLQKGDPFDVFSINNSILQSFAVYCQKGEDIDRLNDYMLQLGFDNYQFALAIYGASKGFASLPKTFTNSLISPCEFYLNFYKDLCKNLFNIQLKSLEFIKSETVKGSPESVNPNTITIKSKINDVGSEKTVISGKPDNKSTPTNSDYNLHSPKTFMTIADNIFSARTNAYKALKKANFANDVNAYNDEQFREKIFVIVESALPSTKASRNDILKKIGKIIELEGKKHNYDEFIVVLNSLLSPDDASYKKIVNLVFPTSRISSTTSKNQASEIKDQKVYPSELPYIASFFSLPEKALKRLEQNWKYTESQYPTDRVEHIRYFLNLCKKEGRGDAYKPTSLTGVFSERIASEAEKELYDLYHV